MPADQTSDTQPPVTDAGKGDTQQSNTPPDSTTQTPVLSEAEAVKLFDSAVESTTEPTKAEPTATETPKSEPTKSDATTEKATTDEEPKLPEIPKVRHPLDEDDDPEIEVDPKFTKIQANVEKLREKLRKARSDGAMGRALVDLATRENIPPQQLAELVQKNLKFVKGDATATAEIAAELAKRGYKLSTDVEEEIRTEANKIFKEQFAKGVEDRHIDEDYAKEQAKLIAQRIVQSRPRPELTQQQVAPTVRQPSQPQTQLTDLAANEVNTLDAQIEQSYKAAGLDYGPIRAETQRRIRAGAEAGKVISPQLWAYTYRQTVAAVQSELLSKQRLTTKPQVKAQNTMTPNTQIRKDDGSREAFLRSIAESL